MTCRSPLGPAVTVLLTVSLLAGCGSTVQQRTMTSSLGTGLGTGSSGPTGDGSDLGAPAASVDSDAASGSAGAGSSPHDGAGAVGGRSGAPAGSAGPNAVADGTAARAQTGAPLKVGFIVTPDLGETAKRLGYEGLSTGDGARQVRAVVKLVNSRGGAGGHRVVPVLFTYDVGGDSQGQQQAACSTFFEDNDVSAVVSTVPLEQVVACSQKRRVPYVTSGNRTTDAETLGRNPLLVLPSQMPVEQVVATLVPSLKRQQYFTAAAGEAALRVGLLYSDSPDFAKVPDLVSRALKSEGLSLTDSQAMPVVDDTSRTTAASAAGSNAVLRFSSKGINRVVAVDKSGHGVAYFGIAAQNQSYYPRLGLSSLSLVSQLRTVLSARQLQGARGIGWAPLYDVPLSKQPSPNANTRGCLQALRAEGENTEAATPRAFGLTYCDSLLALSAIWTAGDATADGAVAGLSRLGTSFSSTMTFATDFSRGRAPVTSVRPFAFTTECDCFTYSRGLENVDSGS